MITTASYMIGSRRCFVMNNRRNITIQYIYGLLSFKDILWLKFYRNRKLFMDTLASFIEPHDNRIYNTFTFNFVENKDYCEVLEQYYRCYKEYENMSDDEKMIELVKGVKSRYRNCGIFEYSDITIPDKFKPFFSVNYYIVEKFPVPMSLKNDFVYFLFHYLQRNTFLLRTSYKVNPWFLSDKHNKYYKNNKELILLSDCEIDKIYMKLRENTDVFTANK